MLTLAARQHVRRHLAHLIAVLAVAAVTISARPGLADEAQTPQHDEAAPTPPKVYSPFAVDLGVDHDSNRPFTIITFEDVGMVLERDGDPSVAPLIYEVISQSVADRIGLEPRLDYAPTPIFDARLNEAHNHVFCDQRHLYVALWRGFEPHRWGFSLWSGCGEDDQFAWREIVAPYDPTLSLPDLVEPLTHAIVESLTEAEASQCFQLNC